MSRRTIVDIIRPPRGMTPHCGSFCREVVYSNGVHAQRHYHGNAKVKRRRRKQPLSTWGERMDRSMGIRAESHGQVRAAERDYLRRFCA